MQQAQTLVLCCLMLYHHQLIVTRKFLFYFIILISDFYTLWLIHMDGRSTTNLCACGVKSKHGWLIDWLIWCCCIVISDDPHPCSLSSVSCLVFYRHDLSTYLPTYVPPSVLASSKSWLDNPVLHKGLDCQECESIMVWFLFRTG